VRHARRHKFLNCQRKNIRQSELVALNRILPAVDMLIISLNTAELLREIFWPRQKLKSKFRITGGNSWIPTDLAAGGS
jgi:hypothetical protein